MVQCIIVRFLPTLAPSTRHDNKRNDVKLEIKEQLLMQQLTHSHRHAIDAKTINNAMIGKLSSILQGVVQH